MRDGDEFFGFGMLGCDFLFEGEVLLKVAPAGKGFKTWEGCEFQGGEGCGACSRGVDSSAGDRVGGVFLVGVEVAVVGGGGGDGGVDCSAVNIARGCDGDGEWCPGEFAPSGCEGGREVGGRHHHAHEGGRGVDIEGGVAARAGARSCGGHYGNLGWKSGMEISINSEDARRVASVVRTPV